MRRELTETVVERLSSKSFEMPTLPGVAIRALAMAQDEDSTSTQLGALIMEDQALAANLLRLANSPAFGGARSIVSLQQAITRLGMQTVAEIAVTICVKGAVFPKKRMPKVAQALWSHALATALFAKEIARQQRRNVEAAYLCGLLHRVGMSIVLKAITEVVEDSAKLTESEVRAVLQDLHVEIGLRACQEWQLPEQVLVAIRDSHDYASTDQHRHLAAVVHLASALADNLLSQVDEGHCVEELPVLDELSIYPDQLAQVIKHSERIAAVAA